MTIKNNVILQRYIDENGLVDYQKLSENPWLQDQILEIENQNLESMSYYEEFSFWLNAYNLITIKSVLEEIKRNQNWKGVTSRYSKLKFFVLYRHKIANRQISLYHLENKILRKKFKDPRLHFALNCASTSCPYLPDKLFTSENLNSYLEELSINFINNQGGVIFKNSKVYISQIFKWYQKDFGGRSGVIDFINSYLKKNKIAKLAKLYYIDYDWSVNTNSNDMESKK